MKPDWHYYEAHVTIEPVFDTNLALLKALSETYEFRVADLLMKKTEEATPEVSRLDTFTTGRSDNLSELIGRTADFVMNLSMFGFTVLRYKIESTVIDSKFDDKLGLL